MRDHSCNVRVMGKIRDESLEFFYIMAVLR